MKSLLFTVCFALLGSCIQAVPWLPENSTDPNWINLHNSYKQNTAINGANISVIFYGASITYGWGNEGKSIFNERYAPLGAVNYGISGDRCEHLLYRIADGEVDGLNPKVVVVNIGNNNGGDSQDDVVRGMKAVADLIAQRLPNTKIILLGILPRGDASFFTRHYDINIKVSKHDNQKNIFFFDMFNQFAVSWGVVDPALFQGDKLHLLTAGYQRWADTMDSIFNYLLKL